MNYCIRLFVSLALIILFVVPARAAITGTISGTTTDLTGAVLPGVAVMAINQDTGIKRSVITDSKGFYSFTALNVGAYTITAAENGFESYHETGIKVDANSSLRVDVQMKVGGNSVTLNVESNTVQVETQTTQLGEVIEAQKMTSVPLNGRSYTDLLALQPGVSPYNATTEGASSGVSGDLNPGNVSINGGREASNGFMVNGGDVNEGVNNGAAIIPNLDSISEFRIITNNFDAEYGNFSGGQVNVVTKNGTNALHGSAFEFFRNTDLDARNYFSPTRGVFNQNIYGGTVGGPIKKDKVFFFADFQGTNQTIGATQNFPTFSNADLTGNLSDQASGLTGAVTSTGLATDLTNRLGYGVSQSEPYYQPTCNSTSWTAGSSTGCVFPNAMIPRSAWDPAAAGTLKYIPVANTADPSGNPYYATSAYSQTLSDYKEAGRVDANTRFGNLFAYYFMDNDSVSNPYAGGSVPGFGSVTTSRAQMANLGLTTISKSNAVNTFRFTYLRSANHTNNPTSPTVSLASLGFNTSQGAGGGINTVNSALAGVPNINFNNFGFGNPVETQAKYDNTFQWLDNYMKVIGTHTIQFGASYHYDQIMERNNYATNGQFTFNGQETGVDFADYLLGIVPAQGGFVQATLQLLDTRSHYIGAYVEDSWRARPNLTFNYGLRYEIITPWYDTTNKLETAIPGVQSSVFPGAPKGYLVPGDPGVPRTLSPIRYKNFAPRLGFAYTPKSGDGWLGKVTGGDKTSIRGGFGIFYTNIQDESGFIEVGDAPYGDFYSNSYPVRLSSPFVNLTNLSTLPSPFPFKFPATNVSASNPDTTFDWASVEPIAGSALLKTTNTIPYVESYYISVQRELARNTVLTVNYVGSQGRHLMTFEEANPGNPALCLSLNASTLAPGQTPCGPGLEQGVYTLANGTVVQSTRTPFGVALGANGYMASVASSNYNSLQTTLKHTTKLVDTLLGYTYSRSFDNSSGLTDVTNVVNPMLSYGLSNFDFTHYFVGSYTVHMPFDNLVSARWAKAITGGWAVSGITRLASGLPVNISETDDHSLLGTGGIDQPNYTPGMLAGNHDPRKGLAYFNTSLFTPELIGQTGDSHRRFFHGPGVNNTDLALLRDFHLVHEHTAQFRAESFNVFNHAQFNNPGGNITNSSTFGIVTSAKAPRILQIAVKYQF